MWWAVFWVAEVLLCSPTSARSYCADMGAPSVLQNWCELLFFSARAFYNKVAVYAKGSRGHVGLHGGDLFVGLVEDRAVEDDVSVFHNDVNGVIARGWVIRDAADIGPGHHGASEAALVGVVFAERGLRVDAVIDFGADAVVAGRGGQDFDVIFDRLYAFHRFDGVFSIVF